MSDNLNTPGKKLSKAREALGLTQEEIARRLFLSKATIQSLESDDYARFSAAAYIKGYLSSYSTILGLSKEEILQDFSKIMPGAQETSLLMPTLSSEHPKEIFSARIMKMFSIGVLCLLILLVLLWTLGHHSSDPAQASDNSATEASKPTDVSPVNTAPGNVTLVPSNDNIPVAPQVSTPADAETPSNQTLQVGGEKIEAVTDSNKTTKEVKIQENITPPVVDISVPQNSSAPKKNNKVSVSGRVINLSESSTR